MAKIEAGTSSNLLDVTALGAAKVSVIDSLGDDVNQIKSKFSLAIPIGRITAVIAANGFLFAMKNGATKRVKLEEIAFSCGFDGTAAASTQIFELVRASGSAFAAGTALTLPAQIPRKSTLDPNSTLDSVRFSGAATLTTVGATIETGALASFGVARSVTGKTAQFLFPGLDVWLEPGEILAIRNTAATVVGDSIEGNISWSES